MFAAMMDGIKEESVGYLFNLEVQLEDDAEETGAEVPTELSGEVEVGPALAQAAAANGAGAAVAHDDHPAIRAKGLEAPSRPQQLSYSAPSEDGDAQLSGAPQQVLTEDDPYAGASRNGACPCGSGKKYKKCCGAAA
jgi:preprotein translocase subunit SecA